MWDALGQSSQLANVLLNVQSTVHSCSAFRVRDQARRKNLIRVDVLSSISTEVPPQNGIISSVLSSPRGRCSSHGASWFSPARVQDLESAVNSVGWERSRSPVMPLRAVEVSFHRLEAFRRGVTSCGVSSSSSTSLDSRTSRVPPSMVLSTQGSGREESPWARVATRMTDDLSLSLASLQ